MASLAAAAQLEAGAALQRCWQSSLPMDTPAMSVPGSAGMVCAAVGTNSGASARRPRTTAVVGETGGGNGLQLPVDDVSPPSNALAPEASAVHSVVSEPRSLPAPEVLLRGVAFGVAADPLRLDSVAAGISLDGSAKPGGGGRPGGATAETGEGLGPGNGAGPASFAKAGGNGRPGGGGRPAGGKPGGGAKPDTGAGRPGGNSRACGGSARPHNGLGQDREFGTGARAKLQELAAVLLRGTAASAGCVRAMEG